MTRRRLLAALLLPPALAFGGLLPSAAVASTQDISTVLAGIVVAAENTTVPYARSEFNHWVDADGDGCDTRAEVLQRGTEAELTYSSGCTVATGQWSSAYDGAVWTLASDVDIDHMVALEEAWQSGAHAWTAAQREAYANDLDYNGSLWAVTDDVNASKGSRDPAEWLPPLAAATCDYLVAWTVVKWRWNLTADPAEKQLLDTTLVGDCGNPAVTLPARATTPTPGGPVETPFPDVPAGHPFDDEIAWLAAAGLATGYPDGSYGPARSVSRQAFAAYLYRYTHNGAEPPPCTRQWFPDVTTTNQFCGHIQWLAGTGITTGYTDGTFRPTAAISRQAMAAFLQRYRAAAASTAATCDTSRFPDVTGANQFCSEITWLASTAITTGYADGSFGPARPVSRQALAAYLYRFDGTFGPSDPPIVVSPPPIAPPPPPPPSTPPNPGNSKNCGDFTTWSQAQAWFDTYYPYYGDVAQLDGDGDLIACESLPGAP